MGILILRSSASASSAEADWIERSTGANVIWSADFRDPTHWSRWVFGDEAGLSLSRIAGDGILGEGCLQHQCTPTILPDGGFARPLKPCNGNGTTIPHDINNAGLYHDGTTVLNSSDASSVYVNGRGGFFGHSSYHSDPNWDNATLHPSPYQAYIGTDYWVQFRVKFSANRFTDGETDGKIAMTHLTYSTTPRSEIVLYCTTSYGSKWIQMYTGAGGRHDLGGGYPTNPDGSSIQPGGVKAATCLYGIGASAGDPAFCTLWSADEWCTVLMHIIPGTIDTTDYTNQVAHRNTGVELWIAPQSRIDSMGSSAYILVQSKLDYALVQDAQPYSGGFEPDKYGSSPQTVSGYGQPYGGAIFALNAFNGGASLRPSVQSEGWYQRYDQVICSTASIPCPAV